MNCDLDSNAAYYRTRAQVERAMAAQAPTPDIRKIHLELAECYSELATDFDEQGHPSRPSGTQALLT